MNEWPCEDTFKCQAEGLKNALFAFSVPFERLPVAMYSSIGGGNGGIKINGFVFQEKEKGKRNGKKSESVIYVIVSYHLHEL